MEQWKNIAGYEGLYEVSNLGRVRSFHRKGRFLKGSPDKQGYIHFFLWKDGKFKNCKRAILVAKAWVDNPNNLPIVCHNDDVVTNDTASNLFWGTHADNVADKVSKNRQVKGEKHTISKLSELSVKAIRKLRREGNKVSDIASLYNVSIATISNIANNKSWTHV